MRKHSISTLVLQAMWVIAAGLLAGSAAARTPPPPAGALKQRLWAETEFGVLLPRLSSTEAGAGAGRETPAARQADADLADWSRIVFQSSRDGNREIYTARGDGSQPVRLTDDAALDEEPRLNRGATRVAFMSTRSGNYEIYTVNVGGSGLARLTFNGTDEVDPVWSPDSNRLAFASNRDGNWEIYVMRADGTGQTRCTSDAADDFAPTWSPDGNQMAWVRRGASGNAIWVMNAHCGSPHAMTNEWPRLQNPAWSPDGARLAFDGDVDGDGWNELVVINLDGTDLRVVYDSGGDLVDAWMGSWSPDGGWLLFSWVAYAPDPGELQLSYANIYRAPVAGGELEQVTNTGRDLAPDWQTTDLLPPRSRVLPLPRFLRVGDAVSWSGTDAGPAGVRAYDVQVRDLPVGNWRTWLTGAVATSAAFQETPGHTFAFRARAWDNAYNMQAWQGDQADTETTLYTWQVGGLVRDTRNRPMPGSPIVFSPASVIPVTSSVAGDYRAHMQAHGTQFLTVTQHGYGTAPVMELDLTADYVADHVLPPTDDRIQNGGLESGTLSGTWSTLGTLAPIITDVTRHTGRFSAVMGSAPFSLSQPAAALSGMLPVVAIDRNHVMHLASACDNCGAGYSIQYVSKPVTGTWPATSTAIVSLSQWPNLMDAAPDGQGGIHLVWLQYSNSIQRDVYYCHKPAAATQCETPINLTNAGNNGAAQARLAADRHDGLHLVWDSSSGVWYAYKPAGGAWRAPERVDGAAPSPQIAVDDLGGVHVTSYNIVGDWSPIASDIHYSYKAPGTSWFVHELAVKEAPNPGAIPTIAASGNGTAHLLWLGNGVMYASKEPGKRWTAPVQISSSGASLDRLNLKIGQTGVAHALFSSMPGTQPYVVYMVRDPSGRWYQPTESVAAPWGSRVIAAVDSGSVLHAAWDGDGSIYHLQTMVAETQADYELSQVVTVPPDMHRPTLSYLYRFPSWPLANPLRVKISDLSTVTEITPTVDTTREWMHAWADMSRAAGKTVTLTFEWRQEQAAPRVQLALDDISLGSWLTPVISNVSPRQVKAWTATPITITGDNLIAIPPSSLYTTGPSVRLNGIALPDARWINTNTIKATVPMTAPPGLYDVWVANPGGQTGALPSGIVIGKLAFLPVTLKDGLSGP